MRETLLTINVVYFLFGATIYCGVMCGAQPRFRRSPKLSSD